jgi:putative spermidine/putrescine transport system permease protein
MSLETTRGARAMLTAVGASALAFLAMPIVIVVVMSFSSARSLAFPPPGFSLRWYLRFFGDPVWMEALGTSFFLALLSSTLAVVIGSVGAYGIARRSRLGTAMTEAQAIAPIVVPSIVIAVGYYVAFANLGLLGTYIALLAAHTCLNIPFVMIVMVVAIRGVDYRLEQVAWSLGASWFATARRILIPNLLPSLAVAWIFAFIHSFDEVVVTSFIAGTYNTIPKKMFNELILEITPTITAISSLLIFLSVLALAVVHVLRGRAGTGGGELRGRPITP